MERCDDQARECHERSQGREAAAASGKHFENAAIVVECIGGQREGIRGGLDVAAIPSPEHVEASVVVRPGDRKEIEQLHDCLGGDCEHAETPILAGVENEHDTSGRRSNEHECAERSEEHGRERPQNGETSGPARASESRQQHRDAGDHDGVDDVGLHVGREGDRRRCRDNDRRQGTTHTPGIRHRPEQDEDGRRGECPRDERRIDEHGRMIDGEATQREQQCVEEWMLDTRAQPFTRRRQGDRSRGPCVVVEESVFGKRPDSDDERADGEDDGEEPVRPLRSHVGGPADASSDDHVAENGVAPADVAMRPIARPWFVPSSHDAGTVCTAPASVSGPVSVDVVIRYRAVTDASLLFTVR